MIIPSRTLLPPWRGPIPDVRGTLEASFILPIPLDSYAMVEPEEAVRYLKKIHDFLMETFPKRHEVLLVPYGEKQPAVGVLLSRLTQATTGHKVFRWIMGPSKGPGSAVREGVLNSKGRKILVGNLEFYYGPSFFRKAVSLLTRSSLAGVWANRRLPDSEFEVPVTLLSMVFRRHLLGLLLGRAWAKLFSLKSTDSLSGAYVLRRNFALRAFNRVTCPGFLYGAEIAVLAQVNHRRIADLPVRFFMEREKPRVRLWGEIFSVLQWTFRIFRNLRRGEYHFLRLTGNHLTADDWGLSPAVNDGILELTKLGHLRRVSVLGGGRYMGYRLEELKRIPGIEFGLHFNLTNKEGGGLFRSPGRFLLAWFWGKWIDRWDIVRRVREVLTTQIAEMKKVGIHPRRLDGHHHIHAVPELLDEVVDILRREGIRYVRVPYHRSLWLSGRALIALLGLSAQKAVQRLRLVSGPFYYPTQGDFKNFNRLVRCLNKTSHMEVLIHPAFRDDIAQAAPSDTYRQQRVREFDLLRMLALELKASK